VRHGLNAITEADIVAVHDGVRPFVTPEEIDEVVVAARKFGGAILTAPVPDTIKRVEEGRIVETIPRDELLRALTPQCFRFEVLRRAFEQLDRLESAGAEITDESMLAERLGIEIVSVKGNARNVKITTIDDLKQAEALLR
jgi:2-C-methyl-D-erythritol 4-phosphate cytidylyltransferase